MIAFLPVGLLWIIYILVNVVITGDQAGSGILGYIYKAATWGLLIVASLILPRYRPQAKMRLWNDLIRLALGIAFFQIILDVIGGLFSGFGKNPASLTPTGITINILYIGSMLTALELSRAWLVNYFGKNHSFLAISLIAVLYTFVSIPISQLTGFTVAMASTNIVLSSWLPLLAENLLATLLALLAGPRASLAYRGLLAAFWWLCPVLPDLSWVFKALLGSAAPVMGMIAVNSLYSAKRGRVKRQERHTGLPASWIVVALAAVVIVWFAVGVFPVKPTLVGSGSMTPVLATGDVVIVAKVPANMIKTGDIIEYRKDAHTNIVHRVINIDTSGGSRLITTKGDANSAPDDTSVIPDNIIGKVVFNIPKMGMISIAIKNIFLAGQ